MEILFSEEEFGSTHAKMLVYNWHRLLNGIAFKNQKPIKKDHLIVYDGFCGKNVDYIKRLCYLYEELYDQKIWYTVKYDYYYIHFNDKKW